MSGSRTNRRLYVGELGREIRTNGELLLGIPTSDEHGQLIAHNIEVIEKNKKTIKNQLSSAKPNEKLIARAKDNIATCKETITTRLTLMGATLEEISVVTSGIDANDIQSVTVEVLKVMARKNPGLHERKYKQALAMVEKQKQAVLQQQR